MEDKEIKQLVSLRSELIENYSKLKDYRQNKNAIMREYDHAQLLHSTISKIDAVLKDYVSFED